jgi:hypothetical protein
MYLQYNNNKNKERKKEVAVFCDGCDIQRL